MCYKVISSAFTQEDGQFIITIYACIDLPTDQVNDYLVDKYERVMGRQEAEPRSKEEVKFTKYTVEIVPQLYAYKFAIKNPIHDGKATSGRMNFH